VPTLGRKYVTEILSDPVTGAPAGLYGVDGREYLFPSLALNSNALTSPITLSSAEFSVLYSRYGTLEFVAEALRNRGFRGQVQMPSGTFVLSNRSVFFGQDWSQIRFNGNGVANTILTVPTSVVNSALWFGNLTWNGPLDLFSSRFSNVTLDGQAGSPIRVVGSVSARFACDIYLSNSTVEGSLYILQGCRARIESTDFWVTDGDTPVACGLYIDENSSIYWNSPSGFVTNPNAIVGAEGVVVTGRSYALLTSSVIGAAGQTFVRGVSVFIDSVAIGPPTFAGTVTTQYSQTINVRTNNGIIYA
jgi:hypothetical protein